MQNFAGTITDLYDRTIGVLDFPDISMSPVDVVEILIISFLFYYILLWIKNTRAWNLFKGIMIILIFILLALIFHMNTILWLAENLLSVGLLALVIIFQPELRKALENLGGKNLFGRWFNFGKTDNDRFSDRTIEELIKASYAMGKVRTGALIVVEDEILLNEYVRTGIDVDAIISSQLLINILKRILRFTMALSLCVEIVWYRRLVIFRCLTVLYSARILARAIVRLLESVR